MHVNGKTKKQLLLSNCATWYNILGISWIVTSVLIHCHAVPCSNLFLPKGTCFTRHLPCKVWQNASNQASPITRSRGMP